MQPRTAGEYAELLNELAARIDTGRLYERDLSIVTEAVNTLIHRSPVPSSKRPDPDPPMTQAVGCVAPDG